MLKHSKITSNILYMVFFIIAIFYMLIRPETAINAIIDTITIFASTIMPSLFPFILCTQILIMLNAARIIGFPLIVLTRLLRYDDHVAGAYASSLVGGYPTGASSLDLLYRQGSLQGNYLAYILLCSNCGPMFVLATIGTLMLGSYRAGLVVLVSHLIGALIVSTIASTIKVVNTKEHDNKIAPIKKDRIERSIFDIIDSAIVNTVAIMVKIFGFLCLFKTMSDAIFGNTMLTQVAIAEVLIRGSIEMLDGCMSASSMDIASACCALSFIISFGGLSVIAQSIAVSKTIPYSRGLFVVGKLLHGVISTMICYLLLAVVPIEIVASAQDRVYIDIANGHRVPLLMILLIVACLIYSIVRGICIQRAYRW